MSEREIHVIYQQSKDTSAGFILPIVFILVVLSSFGYLYAKIQRKLMHISWSEQKCNPRYLFFSGFLDPLDKNPFQTTQDNFQKCVATNIYKDPGLTRVIKHNEELMTQHQNEMKKNLETATTYVNAVNNEWNNTAEGRDQDIIDVQTTNDSIFEHHDVLYEEILLKTTQMFHLLSSAVRYIQGIMSYKVSNYKLGLGVDNVHDSFMTQYDAIYNTGYVVAYQQLSEGDYTDAINTARTAIVNYNDLSQQLDNYMSDHFEDIQSITESCYHLKYNMDDQTCSRIFPRINQSYVDFYPTIMKAING